MVSVAMVMSPDHAPIFRVSSIQTIRQKNDDGEAVVKKNKHTGTITESIPVGGQIKPRRGE